MHRNLAQTCHPDKHVDPEMHEIAARNFQRVHEAYDILSNSTKRQIYDIYGLQGLKAGLEVGDKLKSTEEIRREFERFRARQVRYRMKNPTGSCIT